MLNEIIAINTVEDLLKGDLWEYVTLKEIKEIIGKKECFGMGTTKKDENGEVLFYQKDGTTRFYWIDPETFKTKHIDNEEEKFPFMAIYFPGEERQEFKIKGDLEEEILKCLKKTGYKDAALFLEGEFSKVKLSAAEHLPKLGTESEMKFKSFEKKEKSNWKAGGVYTENYLKELSYGGRRIHLHTANETDKIGGHILSAKCENLKLTIYPIKKIKCMHSDLTVHSGKIDDTVLVFTAENLGFSNTENVKILIRADEKEYTEIIELKKKESKKIKINLGRRPRSEEHTSELQSHSFISYAVFCLKKKKKNKRKKKKYKNETRCANQA